jgi:hypothetical protein
MNALDEGDFSVTIEIVKKTARNIHMKRKLLPDPKRFINLRWLLAAVRTSNPTIHHLPQTNHELVPKEIQG